MDDDALDVFVAPCPNCGDDVEVWVSDPLDPFQCPNCELTLRVEQWEAVYNGETVNWDD
jgi:endogenous inhibitor of DNA gyrase (YacG/DUF329 family)